MGSLSLELKLNLSFLPNLLDTLKEFLIIIENGWYIWLHCLGHIDPIAVVANSVILHYSGLRHGDLDWELHLLLDRVLQLGRNTIGAALLNISELLLLGVSHLSLLWLRLGLDFRFLHLIDL